MVARTVTEDLIFTVSETFLSNIQLLASLESLALQFTSLCIYFYFPLFFFPFYKRIINLQDIIKKWRNPIFVSNIKSKINFVFATSKR